MGSQKLVESITETQLRDADFFPDFHVGDTINVHYTIVEGEKERIQIFEGAVIARKRGGLSSSFTVRKTCPRLITPPWNQDNMINYYEQR